MLSVVNPQVVLLTPGISGLCPPCFGDLSATFYTEVWSKSHGAAQNAAPRSLLAFLVWTVWVYLMPCVPVPFLTPALAEDTQWVGAGPCLEQRRMGLQGASFQSGKTQGPRWHRQRLCPVPGSLPLSQLQGHSLLLQPLPLCPWDLHFLTINGISPFKSVLQSDSGKA